MRKKIAILVILNTAEEQRLFEELRNSIEDSEKLIEEKYSVCILTRPGVESMEEVFKLRGRLIMSVPDTYDYVLSLDPDDLVNPRGLLQAITECEASGGDGILLKEQTFGRNPSMYKHCCRLLIKTGLAKALVPETLTKGFTDHAFGQCAVQKFDLPKSSEVAHFTRVDKDLATPDWVKNLIDSR